MRRVFAAMGVVLVFGVWHSFSPVATLTSQVRVQSVAPSTPDAVRQWDNTVNSMLRTNELRVRLQRADTLIPGRTIEQIDQYHNGVRVWGGSLSRQLDGLAAISVFGALYVDVLVDVVPTLSQEEAKARIEKVGGTELGPDRLPELVILPMDDGSFRLVWVGDIATVQDILQLFIDAKTGAVLRQLSLRENQVPADAPVGHGKGVLGDDKKLSTFPLSGTYITFDRLRPPDISTYDLRSNVNRGVQILNGVIPPTTSDYAVGANNEWSDPAVVDAHVYSSYTYDYYYKRFGRRGLDNADKHVWNLTHLVPRSGAGSASPQALTTFWVNASYAGNGMMLYGEGLPTNLYIVSNGHWYNYFSGAIDIVAHELTHGVTQYSSNLQYLNESGALNEAFSDIMGISVKFFYHAGGTGPLKANYSMGADISIPVVPGALPAGDRSMENPGVYGQPDHYSRRYTGTADNGGVHTNSGIANHAFYLAIEGGTNRTSGIRVQGVGATNREQIEKVFYRGFAQLMPSNANFSMARAITLRAAQDLYGVNSAPYNAVRDAWTAVGVN